MSIKGANIMEHNCLRIKRVWSDDFCMELQITAETIYASSKQMSIYLTMESLSEWINAFKEFPKSSTDVYKWSEGNKEDNSAFFFKIRLFLYDRRGHAAIEIETDNKLSIPHNATTHFYIPTEVSSINKFVL